MHTHTHTHPIDAMQIGGVNVLLYMMGTIVETSRSARIYGSENKKQTSEQCPPTHAPALIQSVCKVKSVLVISVPGSRQLLQVYVQSGVTESTGFKRQHIAELIGFFLFLSVLH